ncbi:MAG: PEP-CTERM sorting domain-containing protein [Chthoniobacterales bacterium]
MFARFVFVPIVWLCTVLPSGALLVPFTEDFTSGNAGWSTGSTNAAAVWSATGGLDGGGYISAPGAISAGGFGTIVFRGNGSADASGDAFVGDWISGGVSTFTAYVSHDAPVALKVYARLDAGSGRAGSSVDFSVAPGAWFQLKVPIVNSPTSFQSYGAGTFATVFNGIQNVQIALSATQDPSTAGQTYNVSLDRVATVPEPGTLALVASGLGAICLLRYRSFFRKPLNRS